MLDDGGTWRARYEKVASGANDWCCLKDADTGHMMFLNKRTGKTQKQKPKHFKEERIDELKFDHITLDDGTCATDYNCNNYLQLQIMRLLSLNDPPFVFLSPPPFLTILYIYIIII